MPISRMSVIFDGYMHLISFISRKAHVTDKPRGV